MINVKYKYLITINICDCVVLIDVSKHINLENNCFQLYVNSRQQYVTAQGNEKVLYMFVFNIFIECLYYVFTLTYYLCKYCKDKLQEILPLASSPACKENYVLFKYQLKQSK